MWTARTYVTYVSDASPQLSERRLISDPRSAVRTTPPATARPRYRRERPRGMGEAASDCSTGHASAVTDVRILGCVPLIASSPRPFKAPSHVLVSRRHPGFYYVFVSRR